MARKPRKLQKLINKRKSALPPGTTGTEDMGQAHNVPMVRYRLRNLRSGHLVDFYHDGHNDDDVPGHNLQKLIQALKKRIAIYPDTDREKLVPAFVADSDMPEVDGRSIPLLEHFQAEHEHFMGLQRARAEKIEREVSGQLAAEEKKAERARKPRKAPNVPKAD